MVLNSGLVDEGEGVVRFVGRNPVRLARLHVDDAQERQAPFPLRDHDVAGKEREAVDLQRRVVVDEGLPASLGRVGDRRGHDTEVLRPLVGGDVEHAVVVIDVVLVAGLAREHERERAGGVARIEVAELARRHGVRAGEDHLLVERPAGADVEQLVLLLVEELVLVGADHVPPELVGAFRDSVFRRVEQRPVVGRPHNRSGAFDRLVGGLRGAKVLHVERVLPVAGRIRRVRQPVAIVADLEGPQPEVAVALGELVQIEEHFLGPRHASLPAAAVRVLFSFLGARVVVILADARRHGEVGLLDPPEHLFVQGLLQAFGRLHHLFGVGVLGLEIRNDFRIRLLAQPEVVILQRVAVDLRFVGRLPGHGRTERDSGALCQQGRGTQEYGDWQRGPPREAMHAHEINPLRRGLSADHTLPLFRPAGFLAMGPACLPAPPRPDSGKRGPVPALAGSGTDGVGAEVNAHASSGVYLFMPSTVRRATFKGPRTSSRHASWDRPIRIRDIFVS